MNFGQAIATCLGKYATFSGRASRPEFWWFTLFQILVGLASSMLSETAYTLAGLAMVLPALAVGARRLHDIGRSGWWQLLYFTGIGVLLLLYWLVQPSVDGPNEYGAL